MLLARLLVGSDGADHAARLLRGSALDFSMFGKHFDDVIHDLAAFIDVRVFATSEQHRHLDFVIVIEKADCLFDLKSNIVFARFGSNSNFLKLGLMRLVFGLTFFLVVVELTKIHDPANRWFCIAGNFHQIQANCFRFFQRVLGGNDS